MILLYPCITQEISFFNADPGHQMFYQSHLIALLEVTVLLEYLNLDVKVTVLYKRFERYITGAIALLLANCTMFVTLLLKHPVSPSVQGRF